MDGEAGDGETRFKHCPTCKLTKPASEFSRSRRSTDGLYWECKSCKRLRDQRDYEAHKDERLARAKEWKNLNPDKVLTAREQYKERRREIEREQREARRKKRIEEQGLTPWGEEPKRRSAD